MSEAKTQAARLRSPLDIAGSFLDSAPVDLSRMAGELGLQVEYRSDLAPDQSGFIERRFDTAGFKIGINQAHSEARKRFTLAHEIAHYLLHRDRIGDGITDNALYRSRLSNEVELEANSFAAELLMPASLVRRVHRAGVRHLSGLSAAFGVSPEAMRIRLRQLGLSSSPD